MNIDRLQGESEMKLSALLQEIGYRHAIGNAMKSHYYTS